VTSLGKLLKKLNFLREGKHGKDAFRGACQQTPAFAANALELNTKFNV
jgi:hypothetical protein